MGKKFLTFLSGIFIGIVNGMLGAGGGVLAVPILKKLGIDAKDAHRNAVAVILPLTVLSAVLYIMRGSVTIGESLVFLPGGLIGAGLGTIILKKISPKWLGVIFGGFMIWVGVRLLMR